MLKVPKELKKSWNYKEGFSRMGGDELFYHSLLTSFINEAEDYKEKITVPFKEGKLPQATKAAHTLKGTAGNLSLSSIHNKAKDTEMALKDENSSEEKITGCLNALFEEMDKILPKINDLIS